MWTIPQLHNGLWCISHPFNCRKLLWSPVCLQFPQRLLSGYIYTSRPLKAWYLLCPPSSCPHFWSAHSGLLSSWLLLQATSIAIGLSSVASGLPPGCLSADPASTSGGDRSNCPSHNCSLLPGLGLLFCSWPWKSRDPPYFPRLRPLGPLAWGKGKAAWASFFIDFFLYCEMFDTFFGGGGLF